MAPPGWKSEKQGKHIVIEQREDGLWGWKKVSGSGRVILLSGDGYQKRGAAVQSAKRENPGIEILGEW